MTELEEWNTPMETGAPTTSDPGSTELSSCSRLFRKRRGVLVVCAAGLAWLVLGVACIPLDDSLQPTLNIWGRLSVVQAIIRPWNQLGAAPGITVFLLMGLLTFRSDRGRTLLAFVATVCLAGISVQTIKHLVGRVRPGSLHDTTQFVGPFGLFNNGPPVRLDSLPSGHTTAAFAMAVALSFRWPRFAVLWLLLAAGVAVSRVLLDSHFPSDVILGSLLGTLVGMFINRFVRQHTASLMT